MAKLFRRRQNHARGQYRKLQHRYHSVLFRCPSQKFSCAARWAARRRNHLLHACHFAHCRCCPAERNALLGLQPFALRRYLCQFRLLRPVPETREKVRAAPCDRYHCRSSAAGRLLPRLGAPLPECRFQRANIRSLRHDHPGNCPELHSRVRSSPWNRKDHAEECGVRVANCATVPHDPEEIERVDPFSDEIPYDWALKHG